jgi:hypothetical protein
MNEELKKLEAQIKAKITEETPVIDEKVSKAQVQKQNRLREAVKELRRKGLI